jgi:hypothetical protein
MALIILGKSKCPLCNQILEANENLTTFPAFLPADHKFGKFSDAALHTNCFQKDPDATSVQDMFYVWNKIWEGRPKNSEEMDSWSKEAFQDWPPKNGVVIYEQCFIEDGEEAEWFWADQDMWEEWDAAQDAAYKEMKERQEEAYKRDREAWQYVRDDD